MARVRPIATFSLVPPVVLLDALVWYGVMSTLTLFMIAPVYEGGLEMNHVDAGARYAVMQGVVALGSVLGGLIAIGVGPHFVLVFGLATAFAGVVSIGICDATTFWVALVVMALGQGMARPGLYATAATALRFPAEHLRNALFVTCWASFNLGAVLAPLVTMSVQRAMGYRTTFHLLGGIMLLAMLVAAGLGIVAFVRRHQPVPQPDTGNRFDGRILGLAVGVAVLAIVPWAGYSVVHALQVDRLVAAGTPMEISTLFSINPIIVLGLSLLIVPVLALMHWQRVNVPSLLIVGVGLAVMGIGILPMVLAPLDLVVPLFIAGIVIVSVGEILVGPFLMSRLLGDLHWRLTALFAGIWLAGVAGITALVNAVAYAGVPPLTPSVTAGFVAAAAIVVGLVFAAAAIPLRKYFVPAAAAHAPAEETADLQSWEREEFGTG